MPTILSPAFFTYPARPADGGRLRLARPRPTFVAEPKYNGWRALVHVPTGTMWNRLGDKLTIASEFEQALAQLATELTADRACDLVPLITPADLEWADCEALCRRHTHGRGCLVLLDLPALPLPLRLRSVVMRGLFPSTAEDHCAKPDSIYSTPQSSKSQGMYAELKEVNRQLGVEFYEGIVLKNPESLYPRQLRDPKQETIDWIKHRWMH